ncbi:MAG: class I SAM-dependent methyltransferase [Ramlibacter sp.]|nr:class I SAM-dependent methyltransferase [Ramlibacter sp.]
MWYPEDKDFEAVAAWGLQANPFAAVDDFSAMKTELRWLNGENRKIYVDYVKRRIEYIAGKNFDSYYKTARKPIDRRRWEFLMQRKAWFIMPLGWDRIADAGGTVIDLGCGDGDTVQRLIDFTAARWKAQAVTGRQLHIVGIDLNQSRVENAIDLVKSTNPAITFEFRQGDLVGGLGGADKAYDFGLITGVLEILEDELYARFVAESCRVVRKGVYIEDLFEEFPGGYPRANLHEEFAKHGFVQKLREVVLSEPFDVDKVRDPMKLWPMLLDQNVWLERAE